MTMNICRKRHRFASPGPKTNQADGSSSSWVLGVTQTTSQLRVRPRERRLQLLVPKQKHAAAQQNKRKRKSLTPDWTAGTQLLGFGSWHTHPAPTLNSIQVFVVTKGKKMVKPVRGTQVTLTKYDGGSPPSAAGTTGRSEHFYNTKGWVRGRKVSRRRVGLSFICFNPSNPVDCTRKKLWQSSKTTFILYIDHF